MNPGKSRSWRRLFLLSAAIVALLLLGVASAAVIKIDDFDAGVQALEANPGDPHTYNQLGTGSALGGERDIEAHHASGTGRVNVDVDQGGESNRFAYTSGDGTRGRGVIVWDGTDGQQSISYNGLVGYDLTSGDTNNGLYIRAVSADKRGQFVLTAYKYNTGNPGSDWSSYSQYMAPIDPGTRLDLFIPFSAFVTKGGTGIDFHSLGALVFEANNIDDVPLTDMSLDTSIDLIEANNDTNIREYGDLPASLYGETMLAAYHVPRGLRLGYSLDAESAYPTPSTLADGDDTGDADDEDGVAFYQDLFWPWTPGNMGGLYIDVLGCAAAGGCYVNGWVDWSRNNIFDTGEHIVNNASYASDGQKISLFTVPISFDANNYYYARFRICRTDTACDSPDEIDTTDGEVEDYRWFGPTAVKLTSFTAAPAGGAVRVAWETASEHDNAGFHLYRSTSAEVQGERLNQYLIPSAMPGGDQGASYEFLDTAVGHGQTYYYLLEDVDLNGLRTAHGPIAITTPYMVFLPLVRR